MKFVAKISQHIPISLKVILEKAINLGGRSEHVLVRLLLRVYESKFKLDWVFSKESPHFYNHRIDIAQFAFSDKLFGANHFYRAFFSSEVIRDGSRLLDIGCGDGFFTRRFFADKCKHIDGIDIEQSAIDAALTYNDADNITYHLLDATKADFPNKIYDVIVWDGAIGHFPEDSLEILLQKIAAALADDGIFVGSESVGDEGADHLQRFYSLDDFGKVFSKYFKFVELYSTSYKLSDEFTRHEGYWRCTNHPDRMDETHWKKYAPL